MRHVIKAISCGIINILLITWKKRLNWLEKTIDLATELSYTEILRLKSIKRVVQGLHHAFITLGDVND
jgi:hypothetical protein